MKNELIALILAGGQGTRLQALTRKVAKPAVFFGGKYRIIDFVLSNCANSSINHVAIIGQYENGSLNNYIGSGKTWGLNGVNTSAALLSPRQTEAGYEWFKGTADAIYANLDWIDSVESEYVLILSGDHIYSTNYEEMLRTHKQSGADCTISVMEVPIEEASRFGILEANEEGRVTAFKEKPKQPKSNLASMGIYIFTTRVLKQYLIRDAKDENSSHDFGHDIIPTMLEKGKRIFVHRFQGYWKDVGTISSLHQANMDLLDPTLADELFGKSRNFPVYSADLPCLPHYIGKNASVSASLVNQGSVILGKADHCVVSQGVEIGEGAVCTRVVLMPGAKVGAKAKVTDAILGPDSVVGEGATVKGEPGDIALYTGRQ